MTVIEAARKLSREWLESLRRSSDSMNMLRKIEVDWRRREWLETLRQSILVCIIIIFVPDHAWVNRNERADMLAGTARFSFFLMVL
jgi:hypothetical protein